MTKKIVDLDIEKVAGVEAAANRRTFLIVKEGGVIEKIKQTIKKFFDNDEAKGVSEVLDDIETREEMWRLDDALRVSVNSILEDDTVIDKRSAVAETLTQYLQELINSGIVKIGRKVSDGRMSVLKEIMSALGKAIESLGGMMEEVTEKKGSELMPINEDVLKGLPEDVQAQIAELETNASKAEDLVTKNEELTTERDGLKTKVDEFTKSEEKQDDILKGASDEVKKQFEDMQKQVDSANEIAKEERETRITKEYEDKASSVEKAGDKDVIIEMLRSADKVSKEHGEKVFETLKANHARTEQSDLLKEIGTGGVSEGSARGQIQVKVAEIAKSENITKEQAEVKFYETPEGKELYAQQDLEVN